MVVILCLWEDVLQARACKDSQSDRKPCLRTQTGVTKPVKTALAAITVSLTLLAGVSRAQAVQVTLYNGKLGGTPNSQGWFNFGNTGATENASGGVTNLNSLSSNNIYAGYSNRNVSISLFPLTITPTTLVNPSFPTLDSKAGYTLSFTVQILNQVNDGANGPNRAGFSVIALSSDRQGIEIGLRTSDIFSQSGSSFTVGEINNSPTIAPLLSALTTYNLNISGNSYSLTAGATPIISGSLRDYTAATGFAGNIYRTADFIFLGDNTTSARANINLSAVSVTSNTAAAAVPFNFNPTFGLLILGAWTGFLHLKTKHK
ncbi:hypothetical protein [Microseira sp. BLCC-F43]|uniref:PFE-CTERM domain-containing protein n=1 Tax=Microseira sp. BLCC-F43 TaxID=3153602 RepID=UPI0035BBC1DA